MIYWLEQTEADMPEANDWLSAREKVRLNGFRFAKRRADWRLGRWTAKHAVAICLDLPLHQQPLSNIEIRSAPCGAPEVFFANKPAAVAISITHRSGTAVCTVALSRSSLGCDLEIIEPRSEAFLEDYFTAEEQALVARMSPAERLRMLALLWSGKESALKALRMGLRLDTRSVIVYPVDDLNTWHPLRVCCSSGQIFDGWWNHTGHLLRTVVAAPPSTPPVVLNSRPA